MRKYSKKRLERLITEQFIHESAGEETYEGSAQQEIDRILSAAAEAAGFKTGEDLQDHLIDLFIRAGHLSA